MINNKELLDFMGNQGLTLIGYMPAQSPIYVLNIKYLSKDKDPFYPIDRSILSIINETPHASLSYIAWLIGFEKEVVESRINFYLIKDGFLCRMNGRYLVTESGCKKYLNNSGERPDVEVTGSIMVDGTTLELLPPMFYEANNSVRFFRNGKINIPHYPIIGLDDKHVTNAIKHIERRIYKSEDKYGLEESAHNLRLIGIDERYIKDIYILIAAENGRSITKRLYFNGHFTMLPSLSEATKKYFFSFDQKGNLRHNFGVTTYENPEKTACDVKRECFTTYLANRYKVKGTETEKILNTDQAPYPFAITITKELLINSPVKGQVMSDAKKGMLEVQAKEGGYLFIPVKTTPIIKSYLKFEEKLNTWKQEHDTLDMGFIESIDSPIDWRKTFCLIGHYNDLEAIDINSYFKHIEQ